MSCNSKAECWEEPHLCCWPDCKSAAATIAERDAELARRDAECGNYPDPLKQMWCCLTCSQTFKFGKIRMRGGGLHCPNCDSDNMHPADGTMTELDSYGGEIGTIN